MSSMKCDPCQAGAGALAALLGVLGGVAVNRLTNDPSRSDAVTKTADSLTGLDRVNALTGAAPGTLAGSNRDALTVVEAIAREGETALTGLAPDSDAARQRDLNDPAYQEWLRQQQLNNQALLEGVERGTVDERGGAVKVGDLDGTTGGPFAGDPAHSANPNWNLLGDPPGFGDRVRGLRNRLFLKYLGIDYEYYNVQDVRYRSAAT